MILLHFILVAGLAWADGKPDWFADDYKNGKEWGFYCAGDGKSEDEAMGAARSACSGKICRLFGVEVESSTTTTETLKDIGVTSQTTEKCPKVRIVGRSEKRKVVSCEEDRCAAYVLQLYPKEEFDREKKRLEHPEPEVRDPAACKEKLRGYAAVKGEASAESKKRIKLLEEAALPCQGLDVRNAELQEELRTFLIKGFEARPVATAMALNRLYQEKPGIADKVALFLDFERKQLKGAGRMKEIADFVSERFDSLYVRNGSTDAYLEELRTCRRLMEIAGEWPADLTGELRACAGGDCRSTSILLLRAQLAACVCASGQECTRVTMDVMNEVCPHEMDRECFKKVANTAKQRAGITIKQP